MDEGGTFHKPRDNGMSNLDYFLVADSLSPACSEATVNRQQAIVRPHMPVNMAMKSQKLVVVKLKSHQRLDTDPDFELVLGPSGGLTIPPCIKHSHIMVQANGSLTKEGKEQWEPKRWHHHTVFL